MTPLILSACAGAGIVVIATALVLAYKLGEFDGFSLGYTPTAVSATPAPAALEIDLPEALDGEGYLYVIEFSTSVVKVGQTLDPHRRMHEHRRAADAFGVAITDYWISEAHWNYLNNEIDLISRCMQVSSRARLEYFRDLGFGTAVDFADELTYLTEEGLVDEYVNH